ncbi:MAG: hypothetical protein L7S72_11040 [Flavobacteriales bacterium]|jgi:hypothetical protein|nr:hypothetical protein [Flavobacteriales bacterium]
MSSLFVEQMRRDAKKRYDEKEQQQKAYQHKIDNMSKHNVGGLIDVREIMKSKQFKEQKNYYDVNRAIDELEQMLQGHGMYSVKDETLNYVRKITGRELDSYSVRETGKWVSELIETIKTNYKIKN